MPYIDYVYYSSEYQGKATDKEFREISIRAVDIVKMYMERFIASWDQKSSIEEYGCDVKKAICYEIDYLLENGGASSFNGKNEFDLKSVKTEGFEYSYRDNRGSMFNGVPFSPISADMIKKELRLKGYMKRAVR
ncbi:hypothetical protein [Thomasclavelia cocleata]|uniref:hypothetical protein n=1 Tax=Thomasclavelia cocleata TaxID=69824 RepID=UPI0024309DFD|nr:hypothetical protein [Thomasclavelia cocleata]